MSTRNALHEIELEAARWEAILLSARDAVISIDAEGRVTLFNQAAEQMFGHGAADVLGRNVDLLMPPPYCDEHDAYIRRYRQTGVAKAIGQIRHLHARRASGEVFPIELSVSEARVGDDVVYSAIIRDVSERHALERALEASRREAQQRERLADIGALTTRIAHDLGNPVAGLKMSAERILQRIGRAPGEPLETVRAPAERIVHTAERLNALIGEFKDFARAQRLNLSDIDVSAFLGEVADAWTEEASARGVMLTLDLGAERPLVRGDASKLRRVFDNLVKNALEAVGAGPGSVTLRETVLGIESRLRIDVRDTGPGFPAAVDPFALFETTKPDGTGLGLSISKQIVIAHGGGIRIASGVGEGTVVSVELPIARPHV